MFWIISFPWTNCEIETRRALIDNWLEAEIFRWNEKVEILENLDWYILAWWFSFEDRGRSWVIASIYPLIEVLRSASKEWKPILWICNWAQILVESGLVSDSVWPRVALSENKRIDNLWKLIWLWFYNSWVFLKSNENVNSLFNNWIDIINIPLAHWEWRFIIPNDEEGNIKAVFKYCDQNWNIDPNFPTNPNWSHDNIAAISNKRGNVMAIMPHPERSISWYWVFTSLKENINRVKIEKLNDFRSAKKVEIRKKLDFDVEIYIKLLIADNEAITVENAITTNFKYNQWIDWIDNLIKYKFIWINWINENDFKKLENLINIWEFSNFEKELLIIKIKWEYYKYWKWGLKIKINPLEIGILVRFYDDIHSVYYESIFNKTWIKAINIITWKYWKWKNLNRLENLKIFANPVSQFVEI